MSGERKSFTITWIVENATLWWYDSTLKPDELLSPGFTINAMRGIRWKLKLFSKTQNLLSNVALSLLREAEGVRPKKILNFELSFLGNDYSRLKSEEFTNIAFSNGTASSPLIVERYRAFEQQCDLFLPQDVLTVRCKIWDIPDSEECIARTLLEVQRRIFDVTLENFSAVPDQRRSLKIRAKSGQSPPFSMNILFSEQGRIDIKGNVVDNTFIRPCICRLFLMNSAGNGEKCSNDRICRGCEIDFFLSLNLTKKELTRKNKLYLPNDVLTLELEIIFPTGVKSDEIDQLQHEMDSPGNIPVFKNLSTPHAEEERYEFPSTLEHDLMSLYNDRIFCDTNLRTEAETFPAHKNVLSARSPVFRDMFTTDMKEKARDFVDMKDLSSDTVRRMLLFLYTDTVEGLEWESALHLYIAADKYGITSLKQGCESYLKKNFCISNVCEILILANMHQISDLKKAVQDYILEHAEVVFRSDEWKRFIRNHAQLAAETMCLKYT